MVEKFYTPKQIAEILQIHPYTILKWIREGKMKAHKFGRVYRTTETEFTNFLGSRISSEIAKSPKRSEGKKSLGPSPSQSPPSQSPEQSPKLETRYEPEPAAVLQEAAPEPENKTPQRDHYIL